MSSDLPPICDYEGSTYRTDFWEGHGREYEDGAERVALRALLPPTGRRLLDLGAGFGRLADLYAGYDQIVLLDYSRSQLEFARQRWGDQRFVYVAADLYRLPLATAAIDTAVMVRVLHHVADVGLALEQIARVLVPGGAFVLEYANKRHVKNVLRYLLGRGGAPFAPEPLEFSPLHYDFHPAWVQRQLARAGMLIERRRSVSLFRADPVKRRVPPRVLIGLDGLLQRLTAGLALGPSQFVRARVSGEGRAAIASWPAIFRCPGCALEPLSAAGEGLDCPRCGAHWPQINGVYLLK